MLRQLIFLFSISLMFLANVCWAGEATDKSRLSTSKSRTVAKKGLVLVVGATGGTGRLVVSTLLENGFNVRAFVRNSTSGPLFVMSSVQISY